MIQSRRRTVLYFSAFVNACLLLHYLHFSSNDTQLRFVEESTKIRLERHCFTAAVPSDRLESVKRFRSCLKLINELPPNGTAVRLESVAYSTDWADWLRVAERAAAVDRQCKQSDTPEFKRPPIMFNILIDSKHRLMYCHHPKVATSSIFWYLAELNGFTEEEHGNAAKLHVFMHKNFQASKAINMEDVLKNSLYITLVRHPLRRLVSAYCDKIASDRKWQIFVPLLRCWMPHLEQQLHNVQYTNVSTSSGVTLMEWASHDAGNTERCSNSTLSSSHFSSRENRPNFQQFAQIVAMDILSCRHNRSCFAQLDVHIRPYVASCNPCLLPVDFIMKLETLQQDFKFLRNVLILEDKDWQAVSNSSQPRSLGSSPSAGNARLNVLNDSKRKCPPYEELIRLLNKRDIDMLFSAFQHDFELFEYNL